MNADKESATRRAYRIEGDRMIPPLSDQEIDRCMKRLERKCGDEPTDVEFAKTLSRYEKRRMAWYHRND